MGSSFAYKAAFQPVVLVLCSILAFFIVLLGIVLLGGKIAAKDYVELLPIATFNCCVLGTLLLTTTGGYTLLQTLAFSLGSSVGYVLAVLVVNEGTAQDSKPQPARCVPRSADHLDLYWNSGLGYLWFHRPHACYLSCFCYKGAIF